MAYRTPKLPMSTWNRRITGVRSPDLSGVDFAVGLATLIVGAGYLFGLGFRNAPTLSHRDRTR